MLKAPVAIVGGGIAGLTAAATLRRLDVPFTLYEAGATLGGLARTVHDADGFAHDFGAHFVTNRLAAAVGAGAACYDIARYGESVVTNGRTITYPLGLLARPRYVASALAARLQRTERSESAAQWFAARYGAAIANEIALPLLEAWSGLPADDLAPSVGDKLGTSIAGIVGLALAGRFTRRAVASGYSQEQPESPHVWHVYPRGGVATLCASLAEPVTDAIVCDSPAECIYVDDDTVVGLRVAGRDVTASAVLCSAPVHVAAKMIRGTDALAPMARFRYRPMVFVNLHFAGRGLLNDVVVWTPACAPFFRLTEAPLAMPSLAPDGKTTITCDVGAEVGDATWCASDDEIAERCLAGITTIVADARARYLGHRVLRTPLAYPVFARAYEEDRRRFARHGTGVRGLYLIGRNGEFRHDLMEDVYWRTRDRVTTFVHELRAGTTPVVPRDRQIL